MGFILVMFPTLTAGRMAARQRGHMRGIDAGTRAQAQAVTQALNSSGHSGLQWEQLVAPPGCYQ